MTPVREALQGIRHKALGALSADERHLLGRYHCWRFGNCTKTEATNKSRGVKVAAAFATMGRGKFAGLTIEDYIAYADRVHEMHERKPWFDPWEIKAVVEGP